MNQGYFPMRETTVIHPDLVEGWVFCRRAFDLGENPDWDEAAFWPSPGWEPFFRRVVLAHERVIHPIMQSVLAYLGENPALFDERLTATNFGFRLNYYPPLRGVPEGTTGRMLGHEDVDLFTILPAAETEGLQLLHRKTMKWVRVAAPPGTIVLNTGDYMQRITNNRLPSTTHRVSSPRDPAARMKPRTSFPMAIYVWEDELLEVLPNQGEPLYPPVRAEDFHTRITSKYYGDSYHTTGEEGAVSPPRALTRRERRMLGGQFRTVDASGSRPGCDPATSEVGRHSARAGARPCGSGRSDTSGRAVGGGIRP